MKRRAGGSPAGGALLALVIGLGACAGKSPSHENLHAVVWVQTSVEYRAVAIQSYVAASRALDAALEDVSVTALPDAPANYASLPPAVILDVDETVLDNSRYQAWLISRNAPYDEASWQAWCREVDADAVPGALAFIRRANELSVTVFYVTNRQSAVEVATRANLRGLGFPVDDTMDTVLTRGENGWTSSDKTARREHVASRHRVMLLVGDNLEDFVSIDRASLDERDSVFERYRDYWGTRWFVLPNPQYGSWEGALFGFDYALSEEQKLERKRRQLRSR